MFNEKVCFAIDNNHDLHTVARFMRHMSSLTAMNKLNGSVIQCIGYWQNELEASYVMDRSDYNEWVEGSGYVADQVCVMLIPGDTRQPCALLYPNGEQISINPLREVANTDGLNSWTYVIETKKYYTAQNEETQ